MTNQRWICCSPQIMLRLAHKMKHNTFPLETVNALVTEPSVAIGIDGHPDVAVLVMMSSSPHWGMGLEAVVDGCLVLGFRKIILDLKEADISSSFHVACVASAWKLLIDNGGTLVIFGLAGSRYELFRGLIDPRLFNLLDDLDGCVDWLDTGFQKELEESLPRVAKCIECGSVGQVSTRGDNISTK